MTSVSIFFALAMAALVGINVHLVEHRDYRALEARYDAVADFALSQLPD